MEFTALSTRVYLWRQITQECSIELPASEGLCQLLRQEDALHTTIIMAECMAGAQPAAKSSRHLRLNWKGQGSVIPEEKSCRKKVKAGGLCFEEPSGLKCSSGGYT
jgi:hypothetical protein